MARQKIAPRELAALARDLRPFLAAAGQGGQTRIVQTGGGSGDGMMAHDLDSAWHSGVLARRQAPWAVTQEEFTAHASNPDAHHARRHNILSNVEHSVVGARHSVVGLTAPDTLGLLASTPNGAVHRDTLLRSGPNGDLSLSFLRTPRIVTHTGQDLDLAPGDDLRIEAASGLTRLMGTAQGIQTDGFASGWAGGGFRLDYGITRPNITTLQIDDLYVRGRLTVYELVINQIRATNGSLVVTSAARIKSVSGGPVTFTLDAEDNHGFFPNDLIRAQRWTGNGIYQSDLTVTSTPTLTRFVATLRAGSDAPEVGRDYVRLGNTTDTTRQGLLYLTSDDASAPYMDVVVGVNSWTAWGDPGKVKTRVGKVTGITGTPNEFGIAAGDGFGDRNTYARLTSHYMRLNNLDLRFFYNGTQTGEWRADGRSLWLGPNSGDKRLDWNGSTLAVRGAVTLLPGSTGYGSIVDRPTSVGDINPAEAKLLKNNLRVFSDYFEDSSTLSHWWNYTGSGERAIVYDPNLATTGGGMLRAGNNSGDDQVWLIHTQLIPFDPSKAYRIKARVRRQSSTFTGTVYVGVAGVANDKVTPVNATGAVSWSSQHYAAASGVTPAGTGWVEYEGYIWGHGAAAREGTGSRENPMKLHPNVRYIRPLLILNYPGASGRMDVDYFIIEQLGATYTEIGPGRVRLQDEQSDTGLYLTPTVMGYWNKEADSGRGLWKTYMDNAGNFMFRGSEAGNYIQWAAAGDVLRGVGRERDGVSRVQWWASAADGMLYAGGGDTALSRLGLSFKVDAQLTTPFTTFSKAITWNAAAEGARAFPDTTSYAAIKGGRTSQGASFLAFAVDPSTAGGPQFFIQAGIGGQFVMRNTATATLPGFTASSAFGINMGAKAITSDAADTAHQLGRAHIGFTDGTAGSASFGHRNFATGGNIAFRQVSNGDTITNAAAGRDLYLRIANNTKARINTNYMSVHVPMYIYTVGTPAPTGDALALWFDGTNLRARLPNGTTRTIQMS